ncbi:PREDICTED: uncharacterized protein LOC109219260 [Nicotiana attenuata]|uniref:uncharacterized protein LOC109219260 n=1 Tax=Nicotiana attenuata TaxID=49451 RepID=UPI00090580A1|nr:PREDICTED: uncharacterized protein LOC109219260 [Nicotiana attenuata]
MTVVYGFNTVEERRSLWSSLEDIAQSTNCPWLVCGDFNAMLVTADRQSSHPVTFNEVKDFSECINSTLSNELQWKGAYYTWRNKQKGGERVNRKIDRAFGNHDWMGPCYSSTYGVSMNSSCKQLDKDPMQNIWNKMKAMRHIFRQLNQKEFRVTVGKIDKAREDLQRIQTAMKGNYDDSLLIEEREALMNLEKWNLIEESILKQKSRAQWIQLADSNSKYFAAVIKDRTQRKQIKELKALKHGKMLTNPNDLKQEIISFYKGLMGSS